MNEKEKMISFNSHNFIKKYNSSKSDLPFLIVRNLKTCPSSLEDILNMRINI